MNVTTKIRIKTSEPTARRRAAAIALEAAGYRRRTERRNGHPVAVWVR